MEPASIVSSERTHEAEDVDEPLVQRRFTVAGQDPFETVEWERRDAAAGDFFQAGVEVPTTWSDQSIGIVAKLYFATVDGVREDCVRQMVHRVARRITEQGILQGHFEWPDVIVVQIESRDLPIEPSLLPVNDPARVFYDELVYVCLHQYAGFNTPTWLNCGVPGRREACHACFPLSIQDTMLGEGGIVDWWRTESTIFKSGGGAGINLSKLRGSMESLATGGTASGPVPYMRAANGNAETLRSGGAHRRAAKFVCLDADHPDVLDFVDCKVREDRRMRILMEAGEDLSIFTPDGERNVAEVTSFQSGNNSVCATDEFMRAVEDDADWDLIARKTGAVVSTHKARDVLRRIAEAAWTCGDPGMIFIDTINRFHTTPSLGPVTTANTCLVGETLVDTSEGKVRIDDLAEMWATGQSLPYAFGFDQETSLPVLRRIQRAILTKMATELVRVTTDKGVVFECTPDHEVLCRQHQASTDSYYVPAGDLEPGQSLRKIGRTVGRTRSDRWRITHRPTEAAPNGCTWQAVFMWEQAFGPIPEGMEVHHLNEDPTDDRLSNLELIDSGTHQSFHSSGLRNNNAIDTDVATLVEVYDHASRWSDRRTKSPREMSYVSRGAWSRAVDELGLVGRVSRGNSRGIRGMTWLQLAEWVEQQRDLVNDRVAFVERIVLEEPVPVYDITVEGVHNFGVCTNGAEHSIVVANCGEITQNDDTACNLAALNVLKFLRPSAPDDLCPIAVDDFRHVVDVMLVAQDVINGFSELPTETITRNTRRLRQCGLGLTNLGAAIMARAMPYDSREARSFASAITALLTGRAYTQSARMAAMLGTFEHFEDNRAVMTRVVDEQAGQVVMADRAISSDPMRYLWSAARREWARAQALGQEHGYRNAQMTAMMPTGTVSWLLGADTTGIEPAFSLVTHKQLAAAGKMRIINQSARLAADRLGYSVEAIERMADGDFSDVREEDLPVFATAVGENSIEPMGHIRMVQELQRFTTQAISKSINLPSEVAVDEIYGLYLEAWRRGIKTMSVYRDGSKATQVLSSEPEGVDGRGEELEDELARVDDALLRAHLMVPPATSLPGVSPATPTSWESDASDPVSDLKATFGDELGAAVALPLVTPKRRRLPRTRRNGITHKIHIRSSLGEQEGYVGASTYDDGTLGEVFMEGFGRMGGFVQNVLSAWSTDFSIALQYGVPFDVLVRKHVGHSDETGGIVVPDPAGEPLVVRSCDSIVDYIARWLVSEFGDVDLQEELGVMTDAVKARKSAAYTDASTVLPVYTAHPETLEKVSAMIASSNGHARESTVSAQACPSCRAPMQRTGTCMMCSQCGYQSGGCG